MKAASRSLLLLLAVAALVVALDQVSKLWVVANLPEYTPVELFPWLSPLFSMTYVKNTGVAFGMFPGMGSIATVLSIGVVIAIFIFHRAIPATDTWVHLALGLVMGGAVGNNIIDRTLHGFVVDFIDVNFWPFRTWPVFNVADSAIMIGVTILLLDSLLRPYPEETEAPAAEEVHGE